jgi:hypothetical protein
LHDCRCDGSADYRSTGFLAARGGADGQVNKRSRGDAHVFGARALLRRLRPELEREHARILKQDPAIRFDEETILLRKACPGDLYFGNTDPVLLTIASSRAPAKGGIEAHPARFSEV